MGKKKGMNKAQAAAAQAALAPDVQLPPELQTQAPVKRRGRPKGSPNKRKEDNAGPRPGRPRKQPVIASGAASGGDDGLVGLLAVIVQSGKTASYWLPIINRVKEILEKK